MASPTLVMATRNPGKVRELKEILGDSGITLLTLGDFPDLPEVPEKGRTFAENAEAKAREVARLTGFPALADDSGLEVTALRGRPGVFSARYAQDRTGKFAPRDEDNYRKLLEELAGVPWARRQARFVCDMALVLPDGRIFKSHGECAGFIALEPKGSRGFGYDPVFWVPGFNRTMAELAPEVKNRISHRAAALSRLKELLISLKEELTGA